MSKVALRVYNRNIETLIDQGHLEEAVAHCQHILKAQPKCLETYRLLGKAYLEARRFPDAGDIFQRVLMAVPDDFVSHLGMSIVCDEQKNLDRAIWHMERAYELTPSNVGVQSELRRLYGRRDGMEPPKIRLTRGALAQSYTKGGQYQQAVVEIKSILAEDPTRNDMKILLARAYFRAGMKVEATEMCTELLKQYPYSLDANRILVEILPGTSLAGSVDQYRKRVQALDPYAAYVTGSIFDTDSVPDTALMQDVFAYEAAAPAGTSWEQSAQSVQPAAPAENLPDWMQQAGWGSSTGEFKEGQVDFGAPEAESPAAPELATAEIPDWLKAMAPPGAPTTPGAVAPETAEPSSDDFDWLAGLGAPGLGMQPEQPSAQPLAVEPSEQAAESDWMKDFGGAAVGAAGLAAADDGLDWLNNLSTPQDQTPSAVQPSKEEAAPDWLSGLAESGPETPAAELTFDFQSEAAQMPPAETAAEAADSLDWLNNLSTPPAETPSAPQPAAEADTDWFNKLAEPGPETPAAVPVAETAAAESFDWLGDLSEPAAEPATVAASAEADFPDWLSDASTPQAEPPAQSEPVADWLKELSPAGEAGGDQLSALISGPGTSENEQDEALKWLESLAEKRGAKAEELLTSPEERVDSAPDWVSKVEEQPPAPPAPPAPYIPEKPIEVEAEPFSGELSPIVRGPGTSPLDQDKAMNWLESLAEKQGAKAEELITNPEKRTETRPDWVEHVENPPTELSALISGPGTSESEQDDAMKWLESLAEKRGAKAEELITNPEERTESAPGWVSKVGSEPDMVASQPPQVVQQPPVAPPVAAAPAPRPIQPDVDGFVPGPLSELISGPGTSEGEQDDAMKWLESLAQKQGAKAEELITNPEERTESAPGWVSKVGSEPDVVASQPPQVVQQPPVAPPVAAAPAPRPIQPDVDGFVPGPLSELISGPGTSESEQDDAMKWLESLAQKQGAKAEELITNPEERTESAPGWVSKVGAEPDVLASQPPVEPQPVAVPAPAPRPIQPDVDGFVPGPLSELISGPGTSESEQDDAMKWLESLAQKQGAKAEELITNPEERTESAPEWVSKVGAEPDVVAQSSATQDEGLDWLAGLAAGAAVIQETPMEPAPAAETGLPDWMADFGETGEKPSEPVVAESALPDWMQDTGQGVGQPAETLPWETPAETLPVENAQMAEQPLEALPWEIPVETLPTETAPVSEGELPSWMTDAGLTTEQPAEILPEETAAEPVSFEAPSAADDWFASLEQPEAQKPAEPMPWEQEAPVEEPVAEAAPEALPWEQPAEETPSEPLPWEQLEAEMPSEPVVASAEAQSDVSAWLKSLDTQESGVVAQPPAAAQSAAETEELPEWLKDMSADEQTPEPAHISGWMPAQDVSEQPSAVSEPSVSEVIASQAATQAAGESAAAAESKPTPPPLRLRPTGGLADKEVYFINRARDHLSKGGLDAAMGEYLKLIKKGKLVEEVIFDLQEIVYRYPVDMVVWQTLGDAYMRSNRLQDALDSYTKAEELLR